MELGKKIDLREDEVIKKRYKFRRTGSGGSFETTIPPEAFEREARRHGMSPDEAIANLEAVWRYNSFHGIHLSFERIQE